MNATVIAVRAALAGGVANPGGPTRWATARTLVVRGAGSSSVAAPPDQRLPWVDLLAHFDELDRQPARIVGRWTRDELYEQRY